MFPFISVLDTILPMLRKWLLFTKSTKNNTKRLVF
nr:MAG TPA: hypothetical protein [Caudoviricetes sp.]